MKTSSDAYTLQMPIKGILQPITALPDPVFAEKMMGDGFSVEPLDNTLFAPIDGEVTQIHPSRHAVTIKNGALELLIHIGLETVALRGEGFTLFVEEGQTVIAGQKLLEFNPDLIAQKCVSVQSAIVVASGQEINPTIPYESAIEDITTIVAMVGASADIAASQEPVIGGQTKTTTVKIPNPTGLHARPAARIVAIARQSASNMVLRANGNETRADSVTGIMSLKTKFGDTMEIEAQGTDAEQSVATLVEAIREGLGEDITDVPAVAPVVELEEEEPLLATHSTEPGVLIGYTASPGRSVGKLVKRKEKLPEIQRETKDIDVEATKLIEAIHTSRKDIRAMIDRLQEKGQGDLAEVFFAHCQLLEDPDLVDTAHHDIGTGCTAAWSWRHSYEAQAKRLAAMDDQLLAGRAADVRDVGERVLRKLLGITSGEAELTEPSILLMEDITPSEIVTLDLSKVVGLCTLAGGSASHAAIIARSNNLPYLVNVEASMSDVEDGTELLLDAKKGKIKISPSEAEKQEFLTKIEREAELLKQYQAKAHEPAVTTDGVRIEVAANIGSLEDAKKAAEGGAEAVGLLRSEFLYLERLNEPTEEEQGEEIGSILEVMGKDRPVIIRTLDVGGDKPLPYLPMPTEENPFLGVRGVRIGLERPSILRRQVRAILSQAGKGRARIMFPMISALDELMAVKALVREEEKKMGVEPVEIGIMIEVPSAALMADKLAAEVDFFSIGTNDLTQYVLAIDRGHPALAKRANPLHPSILRMIDMTVKAAKAHGKWVGVCGGLASQIEAVPVLVGLGVHELSVSVPALAEVKHRIRELSMKECQALANKTIDCADTADVKELLKSFK
ncbi:phosphoenolpyruvate--protein phosphotransferase [Polycladidibacter stylochi]|uniref:phosphoenolpyruvate--protein phosphotransferase n=1 Tax=Polycladidibacter stylochi TaxID=1807766 RepID=UPI00082A2BD7|nr:phosphoenolpyruvate--protein phosphotransferase [Pseudovibrio stylochi]